MPIRRITPAALALAALAACSDGSPSGPDLDPALASAGEQIPTRQQQRPGTFIEKSDAELWSYVQASEGRVAVGLKVPGSARGVWKGRILVDGNQKAQGRAAVLAQRGVQLLAADELLPRLEVRLSDQAALASIRRLPFVDYVEPVIVAQEVSPFAGVGGCGWGSAWTGDRQYTSTGDVYSQKFTGMNIPAAWSYSSGSGIKVGLIDSGISSGQGQFTTTFTSGSSTGRTLTLQKISSQPSVYDDCGHGTRMAGIIAAPWDGRNVAGIAYRASLVSVRHASGVAAVNSSDAAASVRLANQQGAQVIVMAWESLNWLWQVSDEIEYWHYGRQVLFFGAAGTSGCGDGILDSNVIFPADMPEVVAVTGITYPGGGVPCGIHRGSDVELTSYLDVPSTGRYTADIVGMGGSSNATAVAGGIAALVWSRNPTMTRDQVRARLQQTASFYPSRHSEQGYGLMNALKAVRGY
ncbi:MAG TPA: S8/S53 family peptidase [Longimicrobium sp.]|jgi:subtilisin family serine protease|uniref:S8 family peptidase n=1 Tax=Longimicrobium sp. TaxID=2029185 RepID=UPI002ED9FF69